MQYCTAVNNVCLLINSSSICISLSVKYNCTKVQEYILFRNKKGIYAFKFLATHKLRTSQKEDVNVKKSITESVLLRLARQQVSTSSYRNIKLQINLLYNLSLWFLSTRYIILANVRNLLFIMEQERSQTRKHKFQETVVYSFTRKRT